tara:strand:+ start:457 stop:1047 length:591 start_codon:yes stop_codon:yes gene_type:complete
MTAILKVDTIQDTSGNNIINESSDTITIGASGDTTNIIGTLNKDGVAVANTPAFEAYASASQSGIGDNTATKMAMNTELFDTNSMYNTSTYRFTPTVAGKYFVYGMVYMEASSQNRINRAVVAIYKNGSSYKQNLPYYGADNVSWVVSGSVATAIDFNGSSDYVELYGQLNVYTGTGELDGRQGQGVFGAYRIIGV